MLAESQFWSTLLGMPQIAIAMICIISVAGIAGNYWYKAQRDRSADELKRAMIERGMSADEIERVLKASPSNSHHDRQ